MQDFNGAIEMNDKIFRVAVFLFAVFVVVCFGIAATHACGGVGVPAEAVFAPQVGYAQAGCAACSQAAVGYSANYIPPAQVVIPQAIPQFAPQYIPQVQAQQTYVQAAPVFAQVAYPAHVAAAVVRAPVYASAHVARAVIAAPVYAGRAVVSRAPIIRRGLFAPRTVSRSVVRTRGAGAAGAASAVVN
jgi:hypothetical protein